MYYIVYGILYLISLLPLWVLYIIADGFYLLVYYVVGYRRDIVMNNLLIAFPEKTEEERIRIAKKFYHNFIDNFIEAIKMLSASDKWVFKHFKANYEVVEELYKTGKSCHLLLGHTFNWEVGNHAVGLRIPYKFLVVYMPITNKVIDRIFYKMRTRGKTVLLSAFQMRKDMMQHRNSLYALALAADQNPSNAEKAYWLNFFGRPTAFIPGPEKGAKSGNLPVGFCYITKPKRGYYQLHFSIAELNPAELAPGELTIRFVRYLEKVIRENPDMWLWSHRRWKLSWKEDYRKQWIDTEEPNLSSL
jgi:Kdo2-lipid IVA lauroyltransferase/acyltransferase